MKSIGREKIVLQCSLNAVTQHVMVPQAVPYLLCLPFRWCNITNISVGRCVKCLLLLSNFNQNWEVSLNFRRNSQYQIVQNPSSGISVVTDRQIGMIRMRWQRFTNFIVNAAHYMVLIVANKITGETTSLSAPFNYIHLAASLFSSSAARIIPPITRLAVFYLHYQTSLVNIVVCHFFGLFCNSFKVLY